MSGEAFRVAVPASVRIDVAVGHNRLIVHYLNNALSLLDKDKDKVVVAILKSAIGQLEATQQQLVAAYPDCEKAEKNAQNTWQFHSDQDEDDESGAEDSPQLHRSMTQTHVEDA